MQLGSIATETAFLLLDADGKILNVNSIAIKFYGYSRGELLSMNAMDLRTPSERQKFMETLKACLVESCFVETMHLRKDGSTFPAEVAYNAILIGSTRVVTCVIRDLTIDKQRQKERDDLLALFQETNGELQGILDIITSVGALDLKGLIHMITRHLENVLHASSGVILIREDDSLIAYSTIGLEEEVRTGFTIPVGTGFAGTIASSGNYLYVRDAQTEPLVKNEIIRNAGIRSMLGVPMFVGKQVVGVMHVEWHTLHDFNERELHILEVAADRCGSAIINAQLFRKTQGLQRLSEMFIDLMSHDINNMNQISLGYLEMAHDKIESGGTIGKEDVVLIDKAREALQNSSLIIGNVKKMKLSQAGKMSVISINLCDILREIQRRYSRTGTKTVTINFKPMPKCFVMANELLQDVFENLVGNAIKHSPDTYNLIIDIAIAITCEDENNYYIVTVSDNGPGIPAELKDIIFDRFHKVETTTRRKGLGLYLVKTLLEAFNGQVEVEDRIPGDHTKGAKFIVKLPSAIILCPK
jgi:PAS domain S-box-containing protein